MPNIDTNPIKESNIRHQRDTRNGLLYFSIIDVIDYLGLSSDPRNYWKVLKNRLNKRQNKLVTECNQLKLKSLDGKYYLTDVAEADTILKIIESIFPEKVAVLQDFLEEIDRKNSKNFFSRGAYENEEKKLSTDLYDDGEMSVDMYKKDNMIFIESMLAGVTPSNIFISLTCNNLTLKVDRTKQENIKSEMYDLEELQWGKFGRSIELPYEVDIDKVETIFQMGVLSIMLPILDKEKIKIIKIK